MKQMLPLAATLIMGALSKSSREPDSMAQGVPRSGVGILDMLTPVLDRDGDGSIVDDVTAMIGRFIRRS